MEYYLGIKRNEYNATARIYLEKNYAKGKKPVIKNDIACDPII